MSNSNKDIIVSYTENLGPSPTYKPILYSTYETVTKYNLVIYYEDTTTKEVELVQRDKDRPYRITYKKEGQLLTVTGIPTVYEISESSKFCDFPNKVMDSKDLLFEMDCSSKYECSKARFYLKDIRDIIDLVTEGLEDNPDDPMEITPITLYPIYLNGYSCQNIVNCTVDENLTVILTSEVTKMGDPLTPEEYSDFRILSVEGPVIVNPDVSPEDNKIPLKFTEDTLDKEIKIIIKYFIKEINHPVFDEFTVKASLKKDEPEEGNDTKLRAATTQDMQYLGDGLKPALGSGLTPGYKPYQYRKSRRAKK